MDIGPIVTGVDTTVIAAFPNRTYQKQGRVSAGSNLRRAFLYIAMPRSIMGRDIVSATLSNRVAVTTPTRTVTVTAIGSKPKNGLQAATWNQQPSVVVTPSVSTVIPATGAQKRINLNVTALVQAHADGLQNFGWRLTATVADPLLYLGSFDSADSWQLDIEVSDVPIAPSGLSPDGGVIGIDKPRLRVDYTDLGLAEIAEIRVRINSTRSASGPDLWDSGAVSAEEPVLDTAETDYPGAPAGEDRFWQVQVRALGGLWSHWSDWATFTYVPKPTLTVDSPTGGVIGDPTPTVLAHLDGPCRRFVIRVVPDGDRTDELYNSGRKSQLGDPSFALQIPLRSSENTLIFRDDGGYEIGVRAWDREDRISGGPGDLPFVEEWVPVTFDDDLGVIPPTALTFTQPVHGAPRLLLQWERNEAADAWTIHRNGKQVARLDAEEVIPDAGVYQWTDESALPNTPVTYAVRALETVGGQLKRSAPASRSTQVDVEGTWILSSLGDVKVRGLGLDVDSLDRRITYELPGRPDPVDIVTSVGTLVGTFEGHVSRYSDDPEPAVQVALLRRIKKRPAEVVRLVWGQRNIPVILRDITAEWDPETTRAVERHDVTFGFFQCGEFD